MHVLLNVVNTETVKSVDNLFQFFLFSLLSIWGIVAVVVFLGLAALTIFFDPPKWIWLTLAIYMSALGFCNDIYVDNKLAFPLQEIRPFNRAISTGMLVLLLIPTIKASRGSRSKLVLGGILFFFIFEMVFSARFMVGASFSRGILGLAVFPLVFGGLAAGLSRWLQTTDDVYKVLRCVLAAGGLTALGTIYQLVIRSSAVVANGRLLGTTNNPQHLGTSMAFTLPVACLIMLRRQEGLFWRLFAAAFGGVAVIFVLWSQSRSSAIVGVVGLLLFFRSRLKQAAIAAVAIGVVFLIVIGIFGFALPGLNRFVSTLDTRSGAWNLLWSNFASNPLLGTGNEADTAESSYLSPLSMFGLLGSLPLWIALVLMAQDFMRLLRTRRLGGERGALADLVLACTVSMLLLGCFESYLLGTATDFLYCFYIFFAIEGFLLDPATLEQQPASDWANLDPALHPDNPYDWEEAEYYEAESAGVPQVWEPARGEQFHGDSI